MPVKKPTIPERMSRLALESFRFIQPDKTDPIQAPELRAGAKMPPAAPELNEKIDPVIRMMGEYQGRNLLDVNNISVITFLPDPIHSIFDRKPSPATTSPQKSTNAICFFFFFNWLFQLMITTSTRPVMLPPRPDYRATRITPGKI